MESNGKARMTRGERRRLETRARLVAAARTVFGRKGPDAATIAEITEEADVGLGTFYHHFESKEELLGSVAAETAEAMGRALDRATASVSDPAEVMAACTRHLVRKVRSDPMWGWFVVRAGMSLPQFSISLLQRNLRDLQHGIDAGRFRVSDVATAHAAICGAVLGVLQADLAGGLPAAADSDLAGLILRMLGLPATEADQIARRPLPAVDEPAVSSASRPGRPGQHSRRAGLKEVHR
jgi:AcrR family transcriptional regulator